MKLFKRAKIKSKLMMMYFVILIYFVSVIGYNSFLLHKIQIKNEDFYNQFSVLNAEILSLQNHFKKESETAVSIFIFQNSNSESEQIDKYEELEIAINEKLESIYENDWTTDEYKQILSKNWEAYTSSTKKLIETPYTSAVDKVEEYKKTSKTYVDALLVSINDWKEKNAEQFTNEYHKMKQTYQWHVGLLIAELTFFIVMLLFIRKLVIRYLSKPILRFSDDSKKSKKLFQEDELGELHQNYIDMVDNTKVLLNKNRSIYKNFLRFFSNIQEKEQESYQISEHSTAKTIEIHHGAKHQLSSIEENIALLSAMSDSIDYISEYAIKVDLDTKNVLTKTATVLKEIDPLEKELQDIDENNKNLKSYIHFINQETQYIKNGVFQIQQLAKQLESLSINAKIESSWSKEKGFQMVSNQMKDIALETLDQSQNIIHLLQSIEEESSGSVRFISEIENNTSDTTKTVKHSKQSLQNMKEKMDCVAQYNHIISKELQSLVIQKEQAQVLYDLIAETARSNFKDSENIVPLINLQKQLVENISTKISKIQNKDDLF